MYILGNKFNSLPQKVDKNTIDIEELKQEFKANQVYNVVDDITENTTTINSSNVVDWNDNIKSGFIIDKRGKLFKIVSVVDDTIYIRFFTSLQIVGNIVDIQIVLKSGTEDQYEIFMTLENGEVINGGTIDLPDVVIDDTLSNTSVNPVQNKVITNSINNINDTLNNINDTLNNKVNTNDLFDLIYPINSIYMSVNSTNPQTLFGGTWEQLKDRFLLGAGDTYTNGATGGSADAVVVEHKHKYLKAYNGSNNASFDSGSNPNNFVINHTWSASDTNPFETGTEGESGVGKNMPPYLVVYMWKRTA